MRRAASESNPVAFRLLKSATSIEEKEEDQETQEAMYMTRRHDT